VIRPIQPSDADLLRRGWERLSFESRYRRFLAPMNDLSESQLRYLTEVDHHDHEALIALDPDSGEALGVARFVRTDAETAEFAVTVVDDHQGLGLGTALLELLTGRAREEGIARFGALLLAENKEVLELLRRLGPVRILAHAPGTVTVELELPPGGTGDRLRSLLKLVATGMVEPGRGRAAEATAAPSDVERAERDP
jgi:GNAT superfamily N-acetyltransferase